VSGNKGKKKQAPSQGTATIYKVCVIGEYQAQTVGGRVLKSYTVEVRLPSLDCALSIIKNKLLDSALRNKYKDYAGFRTHVIEKSELVEGSPSKAPKGPEFLGMEDLLKLVDSEELPVDAQLYTDVESLRFAIRMAREDEEAFLVQQQKDKLEFEDNQLLAELNS
jgi:hypothetical protein